ncbi:MAG: hypothetical protein Q8M66_01650, partial [Actinomycetota bacterium]|nr:hypothetical protein [Actinomycetota bacterium]
MIEKLRLVVLAILVAASLAGCSKASLTMADVDATIVRLSEEIAAASGPEELLASLQGTVIASDFVVESAEQPPASTEVFFAAMTLQLIPDLLEYARRDPSASVDIKGNTLVMKGKESRVEVEFTESGEVFLIKRI